MRSRLLPLTRRDAEHSLSDALSEHVVFRSPVRDYHGRADVAHILITIGEVLDTIEVQREPVAERPGKAARGPRLRAVWGSLVHAADGKQVFDAAVRSIWSVVADRRHEIGETQRSSGRLAASVSSLR